MSACFLGVTSAARADVQTATIPDAPARDPNTPPHVPATHPPPTDDLDGFYIWLGPTGAVSHLAMAWDSTLGASLSMMRVREGDLVSAIGGSLGASKWTERDGGRIWLDGLAATRVLGWTVGVTAGPIVELAALQHPRVGGSVGVWGFAGFAPFARVGVVQDSGAFVEVGLHLALPVFRR
jgi:hypothetical protein